MALPKSAILVEDAVERPFLTLRNLYITFSKLTLEQLGYAAFVHMFIDQEKKQVFIQACEKDKAAIPFYKEPEEGKQLLVRITGKKNSQRLMELAGVMDCGKGIRFYGDFLPEDNAIVFDMTSSGSEYSVYRF